MYVSRKYASLVKKKKKNQKLRVKSLEINQLKTLKPEGEKKKLAELF